MTTLFQIFWVRSYTSDIRRKQLWMVVCSCSHWRISRRRRSTSAHANYTIGQRGTSSSIHHAANVVITLTNDTNLYILQLYASCLKDHIYKKVRAFRLLTQSYHALFWHDAIFQREYLLSRARTNHPCSP